MIDSVFQLLFRYEKPLTERQIGLSLGISYPKELSQLLESLRHDDRFLSLEGDQWQIAPLEELIPDQSLSEVEFVITDLETTGPKQGRDRIIDIAAQKVKGGEIIGEFESLVNPEIHIPGSIVRLTGINDEMVAGSPTIEKVLPEFLEFAKGCVFVAHNAPFDFSFINSESRRLGLNLLENKVEICTFRMARKLLPQLKACGVSGLSQHFGYELVDRHRAMPDVKATKFFLDQFLEQLTKKNVTSLYELIQFQKDVMSHSALNKKIKKFLRKQEYRQKKKKQTSSST